MVIVGHQRFDGGKWHDWFRWGRGRRAGGRQGDHRSFGRAVVCSRGRRWGRWRRAIAFNRWWWGWRSAIVWSG